MKHRSIFTLALFAAAFSFSLSVPNAAHAQGRRGYRPNNNNNNNSNTAPNRAASNNAADMNAAISMVSSTVNSSMNGLLDPAHSYKGVLVYRAEVQNALALDVKQKNALDALKASQTQDMQKMVIDVRLMQQQIKAQNQQPNQPQTPSDPAQERQQISDKLKGIVQNYQDDQVKHIEEILTPRQRKRLNEIDLRWRGPLALVDPKVAEQAQIGDADKKTALDAYKEFTDAREKAINGINMAARGIGAPGTTTAAAPLSQQDRDAAYRKALADFDKSRATIATKFVASLTPPASAAWPVMIGAPFTFRDDNL